MRILFVGNSHSYFNDMPATFARLCAAAGAGEVVPTLLAYSGRPLGWHLDEYFSLRYNLLYGRYDYCVLQQQAHPFPGRAVLLADGGRIAALCRAGGATPVVLTTWAERRAPEHQAEMTGAARALAAQEGALLAPVGEIWQRLREDHPELELFWKDGEHASPYGSYLEAVTLCGVLTGCDVTALPATGGDFSRGADIAFYDHPRVLEDPAAVAEELDPDRCALIRAAVAERLREG
ncbi:MAG TPA: hypothetical protein H9896_02540 [Candidatus Pygmaiobacter gallistercoris]|nr:hypothetical protein [Candidatus Pygmaiobacter gallistercoris]